MVDSFRLTISLWMIGSGKGNVVFEKVGKFSCESRGELGSSVGDDSVVETEPWEDVLKKDFGDVCSGGSFVARVENYPLRKTMVDHDQNRIVAVGGGQISDKVICWKGQVHFDEMGARGGWDGWVLTLLAWHVAQPAMNFQTKVVIPGHQ